VIPREPPNLLGETTLLLQSAPQVPGKISGSENLGVLRVVGPYSQASEPLDLLDTPSEVLKLNLG
jgi:hypothetical protein